METYHGHVRTPADAIILFEACRIGLLPRVQRRLSEKERQMIRSGSVFVWDEREAGMRRWTDGKSWSASRVSGSFLTYREMEGKRGGTGVSQPSNLTRAGKTPDSTRGSDDDRLDGSEEGPDGYRYKPDGLMKQSFSITTSQGNHLHLISYYSRSHPSAANLQQPSTDHALRNVRPQKGLYPDSTVNDQQNLPVVTRGPMPGTAYHMPPHHMGFARSAPPHPQQPYPPPYAWPPTPLATPPTVPVHYPSYLPPVSGPNGPVGYGHPHHPHHHHHHPHPPPHAALPPPPPPPSQPSHPHHVLPPHYERAVHPAEVTLPPTMPNQPVPLVAGRSPRPISLHDPHQRSPQEYGPHDIRRASPRTQPPSIPHTSGLAAAGRSPHQAPPSPYISPPGILKPEPGHSPGSVPGIGTMINGGLSGSSLPSISAAGSPNGRAEGPRDIPSDKIGFGGEDMRALRQLDKVFSA